MTIEQWAAVAIALVACVTDLRARRIPNLLTFPAALAGLAWHAAGGFSALGWALGGLAVGLLLFFPLFLLRGMGAGDVKLLAALGAWLGPGTIAWVAAYAAIAGGALAIVVALNSGYLRPMFRNVWLLLTQWRVAGVKPLDTLTLEQGRGPRLAYAVPIALGLCGVIWLR